MLGLCPVGLSTLGAVKQVEVSPVRQQAGRSWPDTWCAPVLCTVQYLYTRWAWAWKCRRWCRGLLPLASTIYCPHNKVKTWHREHWSDGSDGSDRFGQWSDWSDRSDSVPVLMAALVTLLKQLIEPQSLQPSYFYWLKSSRQKSKIKDLHWSNIFSLIVW